MLRKRLWKSNLFNSSSSVQNCRLVCCLEGCPLSFLNVNLLIEFHIKLKAFLEEYNIKFYFQLQRSLIRYKPSLFLFFFFLSPERISSFFDLSELEPPGLSTISLLMLHISETSDTTLCVDCSSFSSSKLCVILGVDISFCRRGEASIFE